jgi:hypothetical protein
MRIVLLLIVASVIVALPLRAGHALTAAQVQNTWTVVDKCRKESFLKFPDQTTEGQQQRDKYIRECKIRHLGNAAPLGPEN